MHVITKDQETQKSGLPEMMGPWPLAETASGYDAYSRLLQQLEAVERIGSHVLSLERENRDENRRFLY